MRRIRSPWDGSETSSNISELKRKPKGASMRNLAHGRVSAFVEEEPMCDVHRLLGLLREQEREAVNWRDRPQREDCNLGYGQANGSEFAAWGGLLANPLANGLTPRLHRRRCCGGLEMRRGLHKPGKKPKDHRSRTGLESKCRFE